MRATVFDFELLSHLYFTPETPALGAAPPLSVSGYILWHIDVTPTVPAVVPKKIAAMIPPTPAQFAKQLDYIDGYADLREDRAAEILAQLTPPIAFWSSVANLNPGRNRFTFELLDVALRLASHVEQRFKHALAAPRPLEYSPQIQPMILTPGHGSLPSGHATEAHMIAAILWTLRNVNTAHDKSWRIQLFRQAARIAINRTIAGVHFPMDSAAGQLLGFTLAEYFLQRCNGNVDYTARRFNGTTYVEADDFEPFKFFDPDSGNFGAVAAVPYSDDDALTTVAKSPLLEWLWDRAVDEWR